MPGRGIRADADEPFFTVDGVRYIARREGEDAHWFSSDYDAPAGIPAELVKAFRAATSWATDPATGRRGVREDVLTGITEKLPDVSGNGFTDFLDAGGGLLILGAGFGAAAFASMSAVEGGALLAGGDAVTAPAGSFGAESWGFGATPAELSAGWGSTVGPEIATAASSAAAGSAMTAAEVASKAAGALQAAAKSFAALVGGDGAGVPEGGDWLPWIAGAAAVAALLIFSRK